MSNKNRNLQVSNEIRDAIYPMQPDVMEVARSQQQIKDSDNWYMRLCYSGTHKSVGATITEPSFSELDFILKIEGRETHYSKNRKHELNIEMAALKICHAVMDDDVTDDLLGLLEEMAMSRGYRCHRVRFGDLSAPDALHRREFTLTASYDIKNHRNQVAMMIELSYNYYSSVWKVEWNDKGEKQYIIFQDPIFVHEAKEEVVMKDVLVTSVIPTVKYWFQSLFQGVKGNGNN